MHPTSSKGHQEMTNRQECYFPANDCTVITWLLPTGEYGASRDQDYGLIRGYGTTRMEAIADLVECLDRNEVAI